MTAKMSGMERAEQRGAKLVEAWREQGDVEVVGGHEIFAVEQGPAEAPPIVLLHGFPGSSFDWRHVVTALAGRWRVLTFDFLGYGLSAKPFDNAYSLFDQADLATELLLAHGVHRATLVAHDMGDTVAAELLVRANERRSDIEWAGCILTNGSIFIDMAQLTAGQLGLLALPDEPLDSSLGFDGLRHGLQASFPPDRPAPDELDAMVRLTLHGDGDRLLPRVIRYIEQRRRHQPRWTAGLADFPGPMVAAWGDLDPIAVPAMPDRLRGLRDEARLEIEVVHWPDVGHWPSVEAPDLVAGLVADRAAAWW
jgi:pimeloyl-ACP methyl ester carboxylesterase